MIKRLKSLLIALCGSAFGVLFRGGDARLVITKRAEKLRSRGGVGNWNHEALLNFRGIGSGFLCAAFSFADCGKVWQSGGKFSTGKINYSYLGKMIAVENYAWME